MEKLISVIIPCYNTASLVSETLDSVLAQTYSNIEVVLVNDGSSDNLEEVLAPYLEDHKNFKYFSQQNKGLSGARNSGIRLADGEYLLCLDADDLIAPTYIEQCVAVLDSCSDVKLVYSRAKLFGAENSDWEFPSYSLKTLLTGNLIYASAIMRKADFDKYGPYDENLGFYEDWSLWINMLKDGGDVVLLDKQLFFYRKHQDKTSLSDQRNARKEIDIRNKLLLYEKYKDIYTREFGTPVDMLQKIYDQDKEIESYKQKIEKMRAKRLLSRVKRLFGSK